MKPYSTARIISWKTLILQMNFKKLEDLLCHLRLRASLATDYEGSLVLRFGEAEQKTKQVFQSKA